MPKLVSLRRLRGNLYEAELETEQGERLRLQVRLLNGDVIETPFGRYHISIQSTTLQDTTGVEETSGGESWLVEFNEYTGELRARLSMKIVEVSKKPGDRIEKGEKIAVIETMKMLNDIHAPCSGEVLEISSPGQGLSPGGLIARIKCG